MNNCRCEISDDLLGDDLKVSLLETIQWIPLYFQNRQETYGSDELDCHWYYPLAFGENLFDNKAQSTIDGLDESLAPVQRCWEAIRRSHKEPVVLYNCVLSSNSFGTEGRVHRDLNEKDSAFRARHVTTLVYCTKSWQPNWGGETLVFDDDENIVTATLPKPGRVLKIFGDPLHVGRGVSRICPSDRRVLAFKYLIAETAAEHA